MKNTLQVIVISILFFISQSCSTAKISSNKQQSYNKQPKKIYLIVTCDKNTRVFCNGLVKGMEKYFTQKNISFMSVIQDPLSLETIEDINKKIDSFGPEAVLTIQQTVYGENRATYELTLLDSETKKNVWKSEFEISADSYTSLEDESTINKGIKTLLNELIQDKIII